MSRYIDRDFLEQRIHETMDMQDLYLPIHFIQLMNELDDADVVDVVRCKDCVFFEGNNKWCAYDIRTVEEGYCFVGERREVQRNLNASNVLDALETEVTE